MSEYEIRVNLSWKRPNNIPYPHVWNRLEVKRKNEENSAIKVKIEDVTPDRFEEFLDFMQQNFDHQEPLCRCIEIWTDPESLFASREARRKILEQHIGVIATLDDGQDTNKSKIVGSCLFFVTSKNDPPFKVPGEKWKILLQFFNFVKGDIDPHQILNSEIHLNGWGVAVAPEYYGFGLGFHLLSCILQMSKAWNISGYLNFYTSKYSQAIANKMGFQLCREVQYDEYKDENGKSFLSVEGTPSIKYMVLKIGE